MNTDKPFFVVLNTQDWGSCIMADPEGQVFWFATFEEARNAGYQTFFGEHFGFEVFCRGDGLMS